MLSFKHYLKEKAHSHDDTELVTLQTSKGKKYTVHKKYAQRFAGLVKDLEDAGYEINDIGGYANRNIAGTNKPSHHSHGAAIDINASRNPHTHKGDKNYGQTDMPDVVKKDRIHKKWGLGWGGEWNSSKDTMHFSAGENEGGSGDNWTPPETQPAPTPSQPKQTAWPSTKSATDVPKKDPSITGQIMPDKTPDGKPTLKPVTPVQPKIQQPEPIEIPKAQQYPQPKSNIQQPAPTPTPVAKPPEEKKAPKASSGYPAGSWSAVRQAAGFSARDSLTDNPKLLDLYNKYKAK